MPSRPEPREQVVTSDSRHGSQILRISGFSRRFAISVRATARRSDGAMLRAKLHGSGCLGMRRLSRRPTSRRGAFARRREAGFEARRFPLGFAAVWPVRAMRQAGAAPGPWSYALPELLQPAAGIPARPELKRWHAAKMGWPAPGARGNRSARQTATPRHWPALGPTRDRTFRRTSLARGHRHPGLAGRRTASRRPRTLPGRHGVLDCAVRGNARDGALRRARPAANTLVLQRVVSNDLHY